MSLSFQIKFLYFFWVVNSLRVDFFIAKNHSFPDSFVSFFKSDLDKFLVLNAPERIFNFDFFLESTVDQRFVLWFDFDK